MVKIDSSKDFQALVERLKGSNATHIISMIDFDKLCSFIAQTIDTIINKDEGFTSVDGQIVEYSLSILFCSLLYSSEQADKLLFNKHSINFDSFLLKGLFHKQSKNVRQKFTHTFYILCKAYNELGVKKYNYRILDILLQNIPTSKSSGVDFEQYFSFVQ
jgi:hypothetical protein